MTIHNNDVPLLDLFTPTNMSSTINSTTPSTTGNRGNNRSNSNSNTPRERKQSNPLSQFRSTNSLVSSSSTSSNRTTPRHTTTTTKGGRNVKGKDRYSDTAPEDLNHDDEIDLLPARASRIRGRSEAEESEFDQGWSRTGEQEEHIGLLGQQTSFKTVSSQHIRSRSSRVQGEWYD